MGRRLTQGAGAPRVALRSSLGYLILPLWGVGIDGSLNEARWSFAPTGRKGIAQGKAKRRPGIRYASIIASPERAEPAAHKSTHMFRPFRAWANWGDGEPRSPVSPGWRCALPWAISLCPVGANDPVEVIGEVHRLIGAIFIEMTIPDKPKSSNQRYRLTPFGKTIRARSIAQGLSQVPCLS